MIYHARRSLHPRDNTPATPIRLRHSRVPLDYVSDTSHAERWPIHPDGMLEFTPLSGPYVAVKGDAAPQLVEQPKALSYLLEIDGVRVLLDCGAPEELSFEELHVPRGTAAPELVGLLPEVLERYVVRVLRTADAQYRSEHRRLSLDARETIASRPVCICAGALRSAVPCVRDLSRAGARSSRHNGSSKVVGCRSRSKARHGTALRSYRRRDRRGLRRGAPGALSAADAAGRYAQRLCEGLTPGKCAGLILTAYSAGHSLGGTVWKLRSPTAGTIIMALDWNHNRERHLEATALLAPALAQDAVLTVDTIWNQKQGRLVLARRGCEIVRYVTALLTVRDCN